jgi:hypothetical protein
LEYDRYRFEMVDSLAPGFQETLLETLNVRWIDLKNEGAVHSILFFHGIHQFLALLLQRGRSRCFREGTLRRMGSEAPDFVPEATSEKRSMPFETLDVHARHKLMIVVAWLMADWPERFLEVCERAHMRFSLIIQRSRGDPPYWIHHVADEHLRLVRTRWKVGGEFQGMNLTYEDLGKRMTGPRLSRQAKRLAFIQSHDQLWSSPTKLLAAMKRAGLYTSNYPRQASLRNCQRMLIMATASSPVVGLTEFLGMKLVQGRRWMLLHQHQH